MSTIKDPVRGPDSLMVPSIPFSLGSGVPKSRHEGQGCGQGSLVHHLGRTRVSGVSPDLRKTEGKDRGGERG